ncbi:MAG TPA: protein phosphatase 2C domain-containing protein [Anaerolineales bacterium]|nr:protein phosphatase 2C domain-containing protein [Anaerolineales bacterium]
MVVEVRHFQEPKAGSEPDECEDALAWDTLSLTFAIADGATDSAFQRLWATLLVKSFAEHPPAAFTPAWLEQWLKSLQQEWSSSIDWDNLPWHGAVKARETGALATFLGFRVSPSTLRWSSIAIGDCGLFHFRADGGNRYHLLAWHPLTVSDDYRLDPSALSSIRRNYSVMWGEMRRSKGDFEEGDVFVLATDALGFWIMSEEERIQSLHSEPPWNDLLLARSDSDFSRHVEQLRDNRRMRNDDTSMLVVRMCSLMEE